MWLYVREWLTKFLGWCSLAGKLLYDCAAWGRLLVRDNQVTFGSLVNVVILGAALSDASETEKKGNQYRTSNDAVHKQPPQAVVCRAMRVPLGHRGKSRADEGRFTETRQNKRYGDALWVPVRCVNGRINPGDTRGRRFEKVSYEDDL